MLGRLMSGEMDLEALEFLLDRYGWIVEYEVLHCFGRASFFEDAVAAVVIELARDAHKSALRRKKDVREWICIQAASASRRLAHDLESRYVTDGIVEVRRAGGNLETLVTCLMDRNRSQFSGASNG